MIRQLGLVFAGISISLTGIMCGGGGQQPDPDFDARVARPAFSSVHPVVLFDEGHRNLHSIETTYRPFAELLRSDGFTVAATRTEFTASALERAAILVVVNPKGREHPYDSALTDRECDAVADWVRNGGNLLLVADHYPFGSSSENLSLRFGVAMSKGFVNDSLHCDSPTRSPVDGNSQLVFTRKDGLLVDCPLTNGRDSSERVERVMTFTGQSLMGPPESVPFLKLAATAYDVVPDSVWDTSELIFFTNTHTRFGDPVSAAGKSQGIALTFGKGRVVILGEAAILTAQVAGKEKFGMQLAEIDNKRLVLNIMHWLSGTL